jgi:hypothetical protein
MIPGAPEGEDRRLELELRAVAAARSRGLGEHPSPDELVDYHLDCLTAEEADRVQDHLTLCRECAEVVLDLAAFSRPAVGEEAPPVVDLNREWERLEERRAREAGADSRRIPRKRGILWALAASVMAALGLFGWNIGLRRELTEARRPRADIALVDLSPEARGAARSPEAPMRIQLRPEQGRLLLLLNLGDLREFPAYRMELLDSSGGVIWTRSGVPRGEDGTFLLELPSRMLEPKVYRVRLYGERTGESVSLAIYSFEVVPGGGADRRR